MKNTIGYIQKAAGQLVLAVAAVLLVLAAAPTAFAAPAQNTTVRVGYIDYEGFIEPQSNGNFHGYGVQYLKEIAKYTGWEYEYVHGTWAEIMQALKDGGIDLICQAQKSPEREENYLFSKYSDGAESSVLYTSADNTTLFYNGYEDFNGITVGMLTGSYQNASFAAYAAKKGFAYTPRYYDNERDAFDALAAGKVDTVAMGSLAAKTGCKVLCRFGSDPFYFITGKQNQALMDQVDNAMEEILGLNPYFAMALYQEYYGDTESASLNLTKEEQAYIQSAGVITVGQLRNRAPLSAMDAGTGVLTGITEDILQVISGMTGLQFACVPIALDVKPVDALKAGDFDVAMGILRTENFLTDPELQVSDCFLESTLAVVMRKGEDYDPQNNYTVALKNSFQAMQEYITQNYPQYQTKYYSEDEDCMKAVLRGEADLVMQNVYTMNYLMQKPRYANLEMLPTTFLTEQNCMAMLRTADPRLLSILNKAIASLDPAQVDAAIIANTTAKPYQLTTADVFYKYRVQIILSSVLILFCFVLLCMVIAARHRNEKMLEKKNAQLAQAVAQADRASTAKSQFLSRMSHEIRTPMNAIVGLTTIARQHEGDAEKTEDYLTKIETSSKVLLNIINDVLDMSAIESNKLKIANEEFDIKQILTSITTIYYPQCEGKGVRFEMSTDLEDEIFRGDSLRVSQILLNLVSNAYKFTEKGGSIRVSVTETARKDKTAFLRFVVADTGAGMSQELQSRLFQPFEQETAGTAQKHGGSGLGLSIAKNLVDLMHGAIRVESKKGKGTTFTVDLPLEFTNQKSRVSGDWLRAIRILVVDDDETSLDYASIVLRRIGVPFEVASSGQRALEMIEQAENAGKPYSVVMLDWKMPDMDGVEVTRRIRANEKHKTIIIIVSAYDLNQVEDEAKVAGADHFVPKPLFQSTVFNVLMTLSNGQLRTESAEPDKFDFTGYRVLLAEDNDLNAEIATELLEMVHLPVDRAENGQRAVEMFAASAPGQYDAILMDIQMPVLDGYGATRAIRALKRPDAGQIPIFAMTANAFTEDVAQALSAGMNGHVAKPIDTKILYQTLRAAFCAAGGATAAK